jgi:hypothetical protein
MSPSAAELAQQHAWHNAQAQAQAQAETVTWRWMAGHATWQEARQAQLAAWPSALPAQLPRAASGAIPDEVNSTAAKAVQLAGDYRVMAQEIDRRRAPSASGDHLYIAVVSGLPGATGMAASGLDATSYAPGSKWVVRIRRHHPEQISCTCGGALPQGAACGHIGAVLLLLGRA